MLTIARQRGGSNLEKPSEIVRGAACRLPWAWDRLCFGVAFQEASLLGLRDVVNNIAPASIVGDVVWVRDNEGNPAAYLDVWSYIEFPSAPVHDAPSTEVTMYVRFKKIGTAVQGASMIANVHTDASLPWVSWCLGDTDPATGKLDGAVYTTAQSTPLETTDTTVISTTQWVSAFLRWRTNEAPRLDVVGERSTPLSGTTNGSTLGGTLVYNAGKPVRINASDNTAASYGAYYSQVLAWGKRLTDAEMLALVYDPFGWFAPRRETIIMAGPFPVFARGGPNVQHSPDPVESSVAGPYALPVSSSQLFGG